MSRDLYTEVTNRILHDMEQGTMPWQKSWNGEARSSLTMPRNAVTGRPYRGINILMLWGMHADPRYLTFKQARDTGGTVRKGEHGYSIVFYTPLLIKDKTTGKDKKIPLLKNYTVFHVSQCDGCKLPTHDTEQPIIPSDTKELLEGLSVKIAYGGDRACYAPSLDMLTMPYSQDFTNTDEYRATLYHELTHWTGHKTRLDRHSAYAFEELVAELGGAFMCAEFGLPYQTQHAAYLSNWLAVLKEDNRAILKAASQAQKAVDYMKAQLLNSPTVTDVEGEPELVS